MENGKIKSGNIFSNPVILLSSKESLIANIIVKIIRFLYLDIIFWRAPANFVFASTSL